MASTLCSKVTVRIRKATLEDFEDIKEIGDVYQGRDYIFSEYGTFINNPDIYSLVAVVDSKVVGFYAIHCLDGGQTVVKRAARVDAKFRGQGIYYKLSDELDAYSRKAWPSVQHETVCVENISDKVVQEFLNQGYVEILRERDLNLRYNAQNFKSIGEGNEQSLVRKLTPEHAKLLFKNDAIVDRLIPKRRLLNFFIGFRLMKENIRYLVNDQTEEMYVSLPQSSTPSSVLDRFKKYGLDDETVEYIDLISCSHHHQAQDGLLYNFGLYFRETFDESSLEMHIKEHLQVIRRLTDSGVLCVFTPSDQEQLVLSCLKSHGISDFHPAGQSTTILYERNRNVETK